MHAGDKRCSRTHRCCPAGWLPHCSNDWGEGRHTALRGEGDRLLGARQAAQQVPTDLIITQHLDSQDFTAALAEGSHYPPQAAGSLLSYLHIALHLAWAA